MIKKKLKIIYVLKNIKISTLAKRGRKRKISTNNRFWIYPDRTPLVRAAILRLGLAPIRGRVPSYAGWRKQFHPSSFFANKLRNGCTRWMRNVQLEFSRRPRRDYNYANALLRGRREQATDVWNDSSWKEHLQRGTVRAIEYKVGFWNEAWPRNVLYFQPWLSSHVVSRRRGCWILSFSRHADRCRRLCVATDRGTPVFLFMKSDESETLRIVPRKVSSLIALAKSESSLKK